MAGAIETFGSYLNPPAKACCVGREIVGALHEISQGAVTEHEFFAVTLADVAGKIGNSNKIEF